jgi:hypothetical protein
VVEGAVAGVVGGAVAGGAVTGGAVTGGAVTAGDMGDGDVRLETEVGGAVVVDCGCEVVVDEGGGGDAAVGTTNQVPPSPWPLVSPALPSPENR